MSPLPGLLQLLNCLPTACAVGYGYRRPLRGLSGGNVDKYSARCEGLWVLANTAYNLRLLR
jgi:hypothetical protein